VAIQWLSNDDGPLDSHWIAAFGLSSGYLMKVVHWIATG
jgi:hypothetical protein